MPHGGLVRLHVLCYLPVVGVSVFPYAARELHHHRVPLVVAVSPKDDGVGFVLCKPLVLASRAHVVHLRTVEDLDCSPQPLFQLVRD
eukprot:3585503-Rhodomonas_salina.1